MVWIGPVRAFMKEFRDRFIMAKNGSRTGNCSEPHSTVCSKMCGAPVESVGGVRKEMQNTLLVSAVSTWTWRAPVLRCRRHTTSPPNSGTLVTVST